MCKQLKEAIHNLSVLEFAQSMIEGAKVLFEKVERKMVEIFDKKNLRTKYQYNYLYYRFILCSCAGHYKNKQFGGVYAGF